MNPLIPLFSIFFNFCFWQGKGGGKSDSCYFSPMAISDPPKKKKTRTSWASLKCLYVFHTGQGLIRNIKTVCPIDIYFHKCDFSKK